MRTQSLLIATALVALPALASAAELTVTAVNKLQLARPSQTIELTAKQLEPLGAKELNTIHVKDAAGKEVLCQAVDTDFDAYHRPTSSSSKPTSRPARRRPSG